MLGKPDTGRPIADEHIKAVPYIQRVRVNGQHKGEVETNYMYTTPLSSRFHLSLLVLLTMTSSLGRGSSS